MEILRFNQNFEELCFPTKFPHQEIWRNYVTFCKTFRKSSTSDPFLNTALFFKPRWIKTLYNFHVNLISGILMLIFPSKNSCLVVSKSVMIVIRYLQCHQFYKKCNIDFRIGESEKALHERKTLRI